MTTIYSIERDTSCIADGYNKHEVIAKAIEYFDRQREDDGEFGAWEEEIILVTYDTETDEEKSEQITLRGYTEKGVDLYKEHNTHW